MRDICAKFRLHSPLCALHLAQISILSKGMTIETKTLFSLFAALLSIIENRAIFISHQLHINLTPTSLHFLKVISPKDKKPKTKEDYL